MAISTASSIFTFNSNNSNNFNSSSPSISTSVKYKRATITAAYATAERTAAAKEPETIRSFRNRNNATPSSLYDVLGVRIGADMREIKSAYRKLARVLHPDVGNSSADEFMKVHSAYSTLADPEKRAVYDRTVIQRRAGDVSPMRSAGGYKCRRWETDQCW